jgi:hypothetical protein
MSDRAHEVPAARRRSTWPGVHRDPSHGSVPQPSARGAEPSAYSASAGSGELNSSTTDWLRARHRGQNLNASHGALRLIVSPQRGQFRQDCPPRARRSARCIITPPSSGLGLGPRRSRRGEHRAPTAPNTTPSPAPFSQIFRHGARETTSLRCQPDTHSRLLRRRT